MNQYVAFALLACMAVVAQAFDCENKSGCTIVKTACEKGLYAALPDMAVIKETMRLTTGNGWSERSSYTGCTLPAGGGTGSIGGSQVPVNGKWSQWSSGACSKTCGGGSTTKYRQCNSPAPQNGGKGCAGPSYLPETCNTQSCGDSCRDKYSNCEELKNKGYCDTYKKECCKSCTGWKPTPLPPLSGNKEVECLASANSYRRKHTDTNDLIWDAGLATAAQAYAKEILKGAQKNEKDINSWFKHDKNRGDVGENLSYKNHPDNKGEVGTHCSHADKAWYGEIKDYDFQAGPPEGPFNPNDPVIGHFTQMVWAKSTKVGYGVAEGTSKLYSRNSIRIVVARYSPPGNVGGQFLENVHVLK